MLRSETMTRARRRVAALQRDRGAQRLEQVDRGRVADDDLARRGADQRRDLVADALRAGRSSRRCSSCGSGLRPTRSAITCGNARRRSALRQRAERDCRRGRRCLRAATNSVAQQRASGSATSSAAHVIAAATRAREVSGPSRVIAATVAPLRRRAAASTRARRSLASPHARHAAHRGAAPVAASRVALSALLRRRSGAPGSSPPASPCSTRAPFTYIGVRYALAFAVALLAFGLRARWPP